MRRLLLPREGSSGRRKGVALTSRSLSLMTFSSSKVDVRLVPVAVVARPGERLAYSFVNRGTTPAIWGAAFRVERREHDQWIRSGPDVAFRAIGHTLRPGEQVELSVSIHDDAPLGRYRVTKDVGVNPAAEADSINASGWAVAKAPRSRRESLSFEFDVVAA